MYIDDTIEELYWASAWCRANVGTSGGTTGQCSSDSQTGGTCSPRSGGDKEETLQTLASRPKPPNSSLRPRHEPPHPPRRGAAHALLVSRGHEVEEKVISINSILPIIYFIYPLLSIIIIIIIYAIMRHICRSARAGRQSGRTTVISCRVFRKGVCKKTTRN